MHGDEVIASLRRLRYALAAEAVLQGLEKLARACKANFDPNQPRVPAGNPDGGQWTSTGASSGGATAQSLRTRMPRGGHHFVPGEVFRKLPVSPDVRRILDSARTGRLHGDRHTWSAEHKRYNVAVGEHVRNFLRKHEITAEKMTADQARQLVQSIKESKDPRIRDFNIRIYMREILHWFRRAPRRPE